MNVCKQHNITNCIIKRKQKQNIETITKKKRKKRKTLKTTVITTIITRARRRIQQTKQ